MSTDTLFHSCLHLHKLHDVLIAPHPWPYRIHHHRLCPLGKPLTLAGTVERIYCVLACIHPRLAIPGHACVNGCMLCPFCWRVPSFLQVLVKSHGGVTASGPVWSVQHRISPSRVLLGAGPQVWGAGQWTSCSYPQLMGTMWPSAPSNRMQGGWCTDTWLQSSLMCIKYLDWAREQWEATRTCAYVLYYTIYICLLCIRQRGYECYEYDIVYVNFHEN